MSHLELLPEELFRLPPFRLRLLELWMHVCMFLCSCLVLYVRVCVWHLVQQTLILAPETLHLTTTRRLVIDTGTSTASTRSAWPRGGGGLLVSSLGDQFL